MEIMKKDRDSNMGTGWLFHSKGEDIKFWDNSVDVYDSDMFLKAQGDHDVVFRLSATEAVALIRDLRRGLRKLCIGE